MSNITINPANTQTQIPAIILLDTSGSMSGYAEKEVKHGFQLMLESLMANPTAKYAVNMTVLSYADKVNTVVPFTPMYDLNIQEACSNIPYADGTTSMGKAINQGLGILKQIESEYKAAHVSYYQPQFIIFSDGEPTDNYNQALSELQNKEALGEVNVISVAVENANLTIMNSLSKNGAIQIGTNDLTKVFKFLSSSMISMSSGSGALSYTGVAHEAADLNNIAGWCDL